MVKFIDDTGLARLWARIKTWVQGAFVPVTRKVNNKALSGDITLNAADVGADVLIYTIDASGIAQTGTKNIPGSAAFNAILTAYNAGKSVLLKWDDGIRFPYFLSLSYCEEYQNEIFTFDFVLSVSAPSGSTIFCDAIVSSHGCDLTYDFSYNVKGNNTIKKVISISESAYNALATKDSNTLYVITQ